MLIATTLAGFSGAKADDLRKAIGKKNREAMGKLKPEFVDRLPGQRRAAQRHRAAVGHQREVGRLLASTSPTPPATR